MMQPNKSTVIRRIDACLDGIRQVRQEGPGNTLAFETWRNDCVATIQYAFPAGIVRLTEFKDIRYFPGFYGGDAVSAFNEGLAKAQARLTSMRTEVVDLWADDDHKPVSAVPDLSSRRVFVVHGHADRPKQQVADFLRSCGLDPIILHEQPNEGRTIIEKFETYASVPFAVVLLTPDDRGSQASETELKSRARQNVIFELGFFVGRLGRERVAALVVGDDLEIPSDYHGVVFITMSSDRTWTVALAKELAASGMRFSAP